MSFRISFESRWILAISRDYSRAFKDVHLVAFRVVRDMIGTAIEGQVPGENRTTTEQGVGVSASGDITPTHRSKGTCRTTQAAAQRYEAWRTPRNDQWNIDLTLQDVT